MAEKTVKKPGKVSEFFKGVKNEFKKIIWPSFHSIANNTGIVIIVSIIIGVVVLLLDWGFGEGIKLILNR